MDLDRLEDNLQFKFTDRELLKKALTHRSWLNEHPSAGESNERLEFLGDAVLSFLISELLFSKYDLNEGDLTNFRSKIVCTKSLAGVAGRLNLGEYLLLSKGESESGGRNNPALLENTFESLVGAIYLDGGIEAARDFAVVNLLGEIEKIAHESTLKDYKSLLQEKTQAQNKEAPSYQVVKTSGPDHAKVFTIQVFIKNQAIGEGEGRSKQEAEQQAAKKALENLGQK